MNNLKHIPGLSQSNRSLGEQLQTGPKPGKGLNIAQNA